MRTALTARLHQDPLVALLKEPPKREGPTGGFRVFWEEWIGFLS